MNPTTFNRVGSKKSLTVSTTPSRAGIGLTPVVRPNTIFVRPDGQLIGPSRLFIEKIQKAVKESPWFDANASEEEILLAIQAYFAKPQPDYLSLSLAHEKLQSEHASLKRSHASLKGAMTKRLQKDGAAK